MKKKKERLDFHDDGRTIANMNIEGIRGYQKERSERPHGERILLNRKERRALIWALYGMVFKIAFIFVASVFVIMLFIQYIWFRL